MTTSEQASSTKLDGSGPVFAGLVAVALYGKAVSGALATKLPPLKGSPSHHWPLNVKLPLLTNPTGADTSHRNSNSPTLPTESNASDTAWFGARIGKSNRSVGAPFEKESEFRSVGMNQFKGSVSVIE
jgi:hypothetical protein